MSIEYRTPQQYVQDAIEAAIRVKSQAEDSLLRWDIEPYLSTSIDALQTEDIVRWIYVVEDSEKKLWLQSVTEGEDAFRSFTVAIMNAKVEGYNKLGLKISYVPYGGNLIVPDVLQMNAVKLRGNTLQHILDLLQKKLAIRLQKESDSVIAHISRAEDLGAKELPAELSTPEAKKLLDKAVAAGFIGESYAWLGGTTACLPAKYNRAW